MRCLDRMLAWVVMAVLAVAVVPVLAQDGLTDEQRRLNLESLDYVWTTIRDGHFDPTPGGLDWEAVRDELRPRVEQAESIHDVRRAIVELTDRLGLSHFGLIPGEAYDALGRGDGELAGVTGIDVRVVGLEALVVSVDDGPPADAAGVRPGWTIVEVDVIPHAAVPPTRQALLSGRDPALETAVDWILSNREKE